MPCTLNESFFFLKAFQNPGQAPRSNQEFTQLRRHQQLLTSIHRTLKVTVDVLSLFCINGKEKICYLNSILKCKHFLFSKTSRRRLQDVLQRNIFRLLRPLQDVFKTFSRRLQDIFKTSSRRLQNIFQDVFKTSSRRVCKTSCSYVFKKSSRRLQGALKDKKNVTLKTSWRCLQYVFNTSSPRRMFAGFKWLNNILYMLFFLKKESSALF